MPEINAEQFPNAASLISWAKEAAQARNWQEASQRWALLRKLYPQQPSGWVQGGIAARHLQQYQQSEALLSHALKAFADNPNVLVQWAELHMAQQQWQAAAEKLEQQQQRFPDELSGFARMVDLLALQQQYQPAEILALEIQQRFPLHPKGWQQYAELAMQQHDWPQALTRWATMRQYFPEHAAGYLRAAEAAEQNQNPHLARTLRLAREYGNAWLESTQDEDVQTTEHRINPPQQRGLLQFAELVWTKARFNLKSEANQNYLRYVWWVLDPLLYMAVFYVVFALLLNRGGDNYVLYLLTGLVPFQWFAKTVQLASGSILAGGGLMHQVRIAPIFFPLVMIVQTTGKQLLVFAMLFALLLANGLYPHLQWLALIPIILAQLLLTVVVAAAIAMIIPFARDLANLVPTGLQFIMFMSAVFYSTDIIPEQWKTLFFINPMATLLEQYRLVLLHNNWPEWSALGWLTLSCTSALIVLLLLYKRLVPVYPRVVIE